MGLIYKNSSLTIVAASAASANDGFLEDRPIPDMCQLPLRLPDGCFGQIWLKFAWQNHLDEPLDARAWALQESLLSPRLLYYGGKDLMWICQTIEFEPVYATHNLYKGRKPEIQRLPSTDFEVCQGAPVKDWLPQSGSWAKLVESYS